MMGNCCCCCCSEAYNQINHNTTLNLGKPSSGDAKSGDGKVNVPAASAPRKSGVSGEDLGPSAAPPEESPAVGLEGRVITPNLRMYTLGELKKATRNFRPDTMLGEGGFGRVFKGWIDENTLDPAKVGDGIPVAVKKSNPDSEQGLQEWQSEVKFLGKFSHPNLVKLIGYCWEERQFLLVYEYVQRGSLENHLFKQGPEPLPWDVRIKIVIGAARGLSFLHTSEKSVIFRDFKPSNILLDGDYNAKLSDFGLAKVGPTNGKSHVTTRVMGTHGYAAPEYLASGEALNKRFTCQAALILSKYCLCIGQWILRHFCVCALIGHLYVNSDVYGFGVVLLEMLTGRQALDMKRPTLEQNLVKWAMPSLANKKKLLKVMDPRLQGGYPAEGAIRVAGLALMCLEEDPKSRPSMNKVLEELEAVSAIRATGSSSAASQQQQQSHRRQPRRNHNRQHHNGDGSSGGGRLPRA
ncbi:hypothetical protein SAY86_028073 [Trapa natans]|uniref:non-specific serine/threonine protein kinase n=1 Tax=Trapa natans TaxID=22666 RepID=A0AAN7M0E1_TRANT|nr:hypothetical protein SAY86_028073 [Trapa natans]